MRDDRALLIWEQVSRGIDGERIAGVHSGALDVLHDPGNECVLAVGDGVHLDLSTLDVLVDEDAPRAGR